MQWTNLKQENFSSFEQSKRLKDELNEMEETFRNPNLLIESIRDMQQRQEESLKDIQLKLNEMNQVQDYLNVTNDFKPNLSSFNQYSSCLFGLIQLDGYWLNFNPFLKNSQILTNQQQSSALLNLCEFSPNDKWSLLYRGTRDGFGSYDFHSKCDGHSNTLTISKAKHSSFIFGGFTTVSWDSTRKC